MLFFVIVLIVICVYLYNNKREKIERLISKIKYAGEDNEKSNSIFFSKKLNDEFETNSFLYDTISNINKNGVEYLEIYPDRMEIDNKVINYRNIGMSELQNVGECKALAYYIKSNLYNKNKYEVGEISNLYTNDYNSYAVGYSVLDKDRKYNM